MKMRGTRLQCSVVIPVHNSAPILDELLKRLESALSGAGVSHEVIFVDDASHDASWQALRGFLRRKPKSRIKIVRLTRNFGQHNAILCGFRHCRGRYVVTLDDDLQHPPEEIPRLLQEIQKGYDLVYADYGLGKHGALRGLESLAGRLILRLAIPGLSPRFSPFRAMRLEMAQRVEGMNTPFAFIDGSLSWVTSRVGWIRVATAERAWGASGYSFLKRCAYLLGILAAFSPLPPRIAAMMGALAALAALVLSGFFCWGFFLGAPWAPWRAALAALLLFEGGLLLLALGIHGEHLFRMGQQNSGKPKYLERESLPR